MRIIRQRPRPEDIEIEHDCPNCKSTLGIKKADGLMKYGQRPGEKTWISFVCPVCTKTFNLQPNRFLP